MIKHVARVRRCHDGGEISGSRPRSDRVERMSLADWW
jgi:hypothetical protein